MSLFDIIFLFVLINYKWVNIMLKVKVIDEMHEKDLENSINYFLNNTNYDIIDIQFRTAISVFGEDQIYCFSAMIIYKE